jgi:cytochrome c oxidase subunit 1
MTAIAEKPLAKQRRSLYARPTATTGFWSWFTTIDHKRIGILYGVTAMAFFVIGGLEALLIRLQLVAPNGQILDENLYNQIFTMHGVTMIFFAVMPLSAAFFNYLLPLMIGAKDVAFPRLNAFSYWVFLSAGLFMYSSMFFSGMPDGGWFNYAPLNFVGPDPGGLHVGSAQTAIQIHKARMLYYSLGLQIAGIASLASAVNFIVTILNLRAPGMTFMRMPIFVWMTFVTSFLLLFAMPVIAIALWQLMLQVRYGAPFFDQAAGGDPVLWQHMFWLFGHPEVYILILPAFGIVSEIIPTFSRKPLFGYAAMVFAGIAIGFMGWGVWAHHMFTVGLGPVANTAFALTTMLIAVPTGVKIFNWIGTLWGGQLRFKTPMLFAIGLVGMFTIGGLSGVTHAVVPHDAQQTDTYYIVAHFHYVLFGGAIFGLFGGLYYWWPKIFGWTLNDRIGKVHFWLMLIGFNLTFGPMHILGLNGMPRRIYQYDTGMGWDFWNLVATIGAFTIAASIAIFFANVVFSRRRKVEAGNDPWDARTLEWLTTSPPPPTNFKEVPVVTSRDELWHRKYAGEDDTQPVRVPAGASQDHGAEHDGHGKHHPLPSYFPAIVAAGMPIAAYGVFLEGLGQIILLTIGATIMFFGIFGWVLEPSAEQGEAHGS